MQIARQPGQGRGDAARQGPCGPTGGGEKAGADHRGQARQQQGDHPAAQGIVPDAMGRIEAQQAGEIALHRRPPAEEIGEARVRAADESPDQPEQQEAGDGVAGDEMEDGLEAPSRPDQEEVGADQDHQGPMENAGRQVPDFDVAVTRSHQGSPLGGSGGRLL